MQMLDRHAPGIYDAVRRGRRTIRRELAPRPGANPFRVMAQVAGLDDPLSMIGGPAAAAVGPIARRAGAAAGEVAERAAPAAQNALSRIQRARTTELRDVQRRGEHADFRFNTPDGPLSVVTKMDGDNLVVEWVGKPRGNVRDAAAPGPAAIREILQDVTARYPDAQNVRFQRVSGARVGPAANNRMEWTELPIPRAMRRGQRVDDAPAGTAELPMLQPR